MGVVLVRVNGNSMLPELYNGDKLVVHKSISYMVGDILVFRYSGNSILVHRLLRIIGDRCYCKGDNSFRLECINKNEIIGKASKIIRGKKIIDVNDIDKRYIDLSFRISRLFLRNRYDHIKVLQSSLYREYYCNYLNKSIPNETSRYVLLPIENQE